MPSDWRVKVWAGAKVVRARSEAAMRGCFMGLRVVGTAGDV
jgi:hypothetical protein